VGEITGGLKSLARDLGVPVLALAQVNRGTEHREDKRPGLADLRESGSIEMDADVVMFAYREEYYLGRVEPPADDVTKHMEWRVKMDACKGVAEILVQKNRHGEVGAMRAHFDAKTTKFSSLTRRS
jgi:replicative DNA helicase